MTVTHIELTGSAPVTVLQSAAAALTSAGYSVRTHTHSHGKKSAAAATDDATSFVVCIDDAAHSSVAALQARYDYRYVWPHTEGGKSSNNNDGDAAADAVAVFVKALQATILQPPSAQATTAAAAAAPLRRHDTHCFVSTRGGVADASFLCAVREGLAKDGGLYMRKTLPHMPEAMLHYLYHATVLPYTEAAQMVLERLLDASMSPTQLYPLVCAAYAPSRWSGKTDVCPLTPLLLQPPVQQQQHSAEQQHKKPRTDDHDKPPHEDDMDGVDADVWLLELYHGPTAAFKDFALQLFPRYFDVAARSAAAAAAAAAPSATTDTHTAQDKYVILAATSGDTGVAAISGFVNARTPAAEHASTPSQDTKSNTKNSRHSSSDDTAAKATQVMVLYPMHGVSPVQQLQMLRYDDATHVRVYGVSADFDFCQRTVKAVFGDEALARRLRTHAHTPVRLSSANSINWGRLIPQVAYYFWAYRQRVLHSRAVTAATQRGRAWSAGDAVDVVVPCGNFGNILAAYLAKRMGLPLRHLIVASNVNDVLDEFVRTGCYDIRTRKLTPTASPSIDILKASNIERFVYLLSDGDASLVASLMRQLDTDGYFVLPPALRAVMQATFLAGRCDEDACAATIRGVFAASSRRRLLDPHTAVAVHVARGYRRGQLQGSKVDDSASPAAAASSQVPLIVASTAHWAKFPEPVLRAIAGDEAVAATTTTAAAAGEGNGSASSATTMSLAAIVARVQAQYAAVLQRSADASVHPALAEAVAAMAAGVSETTHTVRALPADVAAVTRELEAFATQ